MGWMHNKSNELYPIAFLNIINQIKSVIRRKNIIKLQENITFVVITTLLKLSLI